MKSRILFQLVSIAIILNSCTVENIDDEHNFPKTDYSTFNYVLATEDASTPDITRFFTFSLKDIDKDRPYDLIAENSKFVNSDPSTSSGYLSYKNFIFSMAKDKKGYSSTPGLYRLTLNSSNRVYLDAEIYVGKNNLFPSRKLCIVDAHNGFFYNEDIGQQTIQKFDPTSMIIKESLDLSPFIKAFRPNAKFQDTYGNNLIRTGSLVLDYKEGKLYVSIVFLEDANFNLISENENNFYLAVIDLATFKFEKIISYSGVKTVSFYVSENNSTARDENQNLYFGSWGWNQFNKHSPSKIFRIKKGETEFDKEWQIDIEKFFGTGRVAQSMIAFNNKIYLHVSKDPYYFDSSEEAGTLTGLEMYYYEFDIENPSKYRKLPIPASNSASRINIFTVLDETLYAAVPNSISGKFNGVYAISKNGDSQKILTIENKYRPTRLYKLED